MGITGGRPKRICDDFGGKHICDCVRVGVGLAVLWETAAQRHRIHRSRWDAGRHCDVRVVIAGECLIELGRTRTVSARGEVEGRCCDRSVATQSRGNASGARFVISGDCPCQPMLVESFALTHTFLLEAGPTLTRPVGAARRHLRCRQHDYTRQRRGESGAQVRVDRLVESARARLLPTDEHRNLLRDIADEAGSEAPLEGEAQLEQRLALRRVRRLGIAMADAVVGVRRDLPAVEAVFRGGRAVSVGEGAHREQVSWWEAYIERPLGRRPRAGNVPIAVTGGVDGTAGKIALDLPCTQTQAAYERVLDDISNDGPEVVAAFRRVAGRPEQPGFTADLESTLRQLASENVVPHSIVEQVLNDPGRRTAVLDAWWGLEPG